jgi:ELWxxDGT repeat protein
MVKDINPSGDSYPWFFTAVGDTLYFGADDGSNGLELWMSDGTAAGTVMVKDINPSGDGNPLYMTAVGGTVYFSADDGSNGQELWGMNPGYLAGAFVPLTPSRILDTRGADPVGELDGSGDAYVLQVTGVGGVPSSGVTAVALNVTVVDGQANDFGGYVTVFPCGTRPDASNLNFVSGQTVPNSVIAPLSADGEVCLYVYGVADVLVDVSGYFVSGFVPLTPDRILDTRGSDPVGELDGSGDAYVLQVTGVGGVPASATAVALNVTVVDGEANDFGGFVTVFPCGTRPDASNLNFVGGQTVPNSVIAPLSSSGTVCFYVYGVADLLVDVSGYVTSGFTPQVPDRILDTRGSDPVGELDGSGDAYTLQVTGSSVPASATAVALNVTVVDGQANDFGGFVTVFPCGTRPDASNLNFVGGQTVPNSVIAPLSSSGTVCLYVYGQADLLVDVSGHL